MNAIRKNPIDTHAMSIDLEHAPSPWRAALALTLIAMLVFGLAYSLVATGLGSLLFPQQATGSMLERDGRIVGSTLVAQPFADARYFQPRPSAAGYDVMALAGSNQARTNPDLRARIDSARSAVATRDGIRPEDVPGELVTQSGSGSDPHLSPAAVAVQIARVARAREMTSASIEKLIETHIEQPQWGMFGQARVNVLELNLALDAKPAQGGAE